VVLGDFGRNAPTKGFGLYRTTLAFIPCPGEQHLRGIKFWGEKGRSLLGNISCVKLYSRGKNGPKKGTARRVNLSMYRWLKFTIAPEAG